MADPAASPHRLSAFHGRAEPGRLGEAEGGALVTVSERTGLALVMLTARREQAAALSTAMAGIVGAALPPPGQTSGAGGVTAVWSGPGQWLLVAEADRLGSQEPYGAAAFQRDVAGAAEGLGAVVDLSDARGVLRLSGPRARGTLAKGVGIDLHPRAFGPGSAALTRCALMDVTLWQVDDTPVYDLAVARGFAGSFWHWLVESGAEYGVAVV